MRGSEGGGEGDGKSPATIVWAWGELRPKMGVKGILWMLLRSAIIPIYIREKLILKQFLFDIPKHIQKPTFECVSV
jgi:hypothetical protein